MAFNRDTYWQKLADTLGISREKLDEARKQAWQDTLTQAVKDGEVDEEQAAGINDWRQAREQQGRGGWQGRPSFGPGGQGHGFGPGPRPGFGPGQGGPGYRFGGGWWGFRGPFAGPRFGGGRPWGGPPTGPQGWGEHPGQRRSGEHFHGPFGHRHWQHNAPEQGEGESVTKRG